MKRLTIIFCFILTLLPILAQETVVVGEVYDSETQQPLPNVNIYIQGTRTGTTTNEEGLFMLRTTITKKRTLVVSAVGYKPQRFVVLPGMQVGIDIALEEKHNALEEVFVLPGSNPALELIERVRAHRKENNPARNREVTRAMNWQNRLYISDIRARHMRSKMMKSLKEGMITQEDSTRILPLYSATNIGTEQGGHLREQQTNVEYTLLEANTFDDLIHSMSGYTNFYDNQVYLMGSSFVSPLAAAGNTYYRYYLIDSIADEWGKAYNVRFHTKNGYYATFHGEMLIDSASLALRSIDVTVPREVSLNHLTDLRISQRFTPDGSLASENMQAVLDMAIKTDTSHTFPTILMTRNMRSCEENIRVKERISSQLHTQDSSITVAIQTIEDVPTIRFAKWLAYIINTGYIPTGTCVEIGNISELLQVNRLETVHLGLPIRTNEKLWKNVSLEANIGYGFRDQALKGMGQISVNLQTTRRNIIRARYRDQYVFSEVSDFDRLIHENSIGYGNMDFTHYAFEALYYKKELSPSQTRNREFRVSTENDLSDNVETQFAIKIGRMGYGNPMMGYHNIPSFRYQSLNGIVRLGWHERKVDMYFRRIHMYSRYPTVYIGGEIGSYETEQIESYRMYGKLDLMVRQQIYLGIGGRLNYIAGAGLVLGKVPDAMRITIDGNQGYSYDPYRFTLMNNGQFITDRYMMLHTDWNGYGVLFNLIPGVRFLHLRELATLKVAWGNGELFTPYVETGIGIGNILRIMDIHSVWKLTHRNDTSTPRWGMRFRIHIGL